MLKERKDYIEGLIKLNGEKITAQIVCASINNTTDGTFVDCDVKNVTGQLRYVKDGQEVIGHRVSCSLYDFLLAARLIDSVVGVYRVLSRDYDKIRTILTGATITGYLIKQSAGDHTSPFDDEKIYSTVKERYVFYYTDIKLSSTGIVAIQSILFPDVMAGAMAINMAKLLGIDANTIAGVASANVNGNVAAKPATETTTEPATDDGSDS